MTTLSLVVSEYRCEGCEARGVPARELVRMMPRAAVMNGLLVGDEWWCCAICFDPKFNVKTKKALRRKGKIDGGSITRRKRT